MLVELLDFSGDQHIELFLAFPLLLSMQTTESLRSDTVIYIFNSIYENLSSYPSSIKSNSLNSIKTKGRLEIITLLQFFARTLI